jgi:hypothetical protein
MYNEELAAEQHSFAECGLWRLRKLLPMMSPVGTHAGWLQEERRTVGYLLSATARSSESALLLCAYGQLWDAEVLVRSVLEGTLKFAYLLQSPSTFKDRHRQFARDLFDIALLKDHQKAADMLDSVREPGAPQLKPIRDLLLSAEERTEFSARYDKPSRSKLERRWGFTGLLRELVRSGDPLFEGAMATAHAYSMASHVQHVDAIGASIPLERDARTDERRETIHLAHETRLISDVLAFMFLRLAVGYRFVGADVSPLADAKAIIDEAQSWHSEASAAWMSVEY